MSRTGFHLLPSFHHHRTQHNYTTQTVTHTVTLAFLSTVHYTDTRPTRNVVFPSGAWFENRPHSTPSIRLARNPKRVIVQWVGFDTNGQYRNTIWRLDYVSMNVECFYTRKMIALCLHQRKSMEDTWLDSELQITALYYWGESGTKNVVILSSHTMHQYSIFLWFL